MAILLPSWPALPAAADLGKEAHARGGQDTQGGGHEAVSFYLFAAKSRSDEVLTARLPHAYVRTLGRYFRAVAADSN